MRLTIIGGFFFFIIDKSRLDEKKERRQSVLNFWSKSWSAKK